MKKRVIGLDVGERRVGVAVSDDMGITAQAVETFESRGWKEDCAYVVALAEKYLTDRVLSGLPRALGGDEGRQAEAVRGFASRLTEAGLKVRFWDERLTTVGATRALIEGGARRARRKEVVDKLAAVLILQGFLDAGGWPARRDTKIWRRGGSSMDNGEMESSNIVELVDEEGQTVRFEHIMTVNYGDDDFVLLAPIDQVEDMEDDEVLILRIEEDEDGEETYVSVEDEELVEKVFERYLELAEADEAAEEAEEDKE